MPPAKSFTKTWSGSGSGIWTSSTASGGLGPAKIAVLEVRMAAPSTSVALNGQHRLGAFLGQLHREGVEEEGGLGVVAHQRRQLHQVLGAELV